MPIDPTRSVDIRAGGADKVPDPVESKKSDKAPKPDRHDHVEISDEARALADVADVDRVPFTEARAAEIRNRLDSGYYDRPEIVREIAERLVDSGDL